MRNDALFKQNGTNKEVCRCIRCVEIVGSLHISHGTNSTAEVTADLANSFQGLR